MNGQQTSDQLYVLVGDDKFPIRLTDSAVQAVQAEAAGQLATAIAALWDIEQTVQPGEGFASLPIDQVMGLRDYAETIRNLADVLIECRPMSDLESDDDEAEA